MTREQEILRAAYEVVKGHPYLQDGEVESGGRAFVAADLAGGRERIVREFGISAAEAVRACVLAVRLLRRACEIGQMYWEKRVTQEGAYATLEAEFPEFGPETCMVAMNKGAYYAMY